VADPCESKRRAFRTELILSREFLRGARNWSGPSLEGGSALVDAFAATKSVISTSQSLALFT